MLFSELTPIRLYQINLQWLSSVQLPFFHQAVVTAFVRTLLKGAHQNFFQLAIHTPESGKTTYSSGDNYCFYLIQMGHHLDQMDRLFELFDALPLSAQQANCYGLLKDNIKLLSIRDGLSGQLITNAESAAVIDRESVQIQIDQFRQHSPYQVKLEFISPTRLKPLPTAQGSNTKLRLCHSAEQISAELIFKRAFDACASLLQNLSPSSERPTRTASPDITLLNHDLFWADAFYQDQDRQAKEICGLMGRLTLALPPLSDQEWETLILAQYIGIGENRRFGCGRYRLLTAEDLCLMPEQPRSYPLIKEVLNLPALEESWLHEYQKLPEPQQYSYHDPQHLTETLQNCWHLNHQPDRLYPKLLCEPDAKERLLLLPSFTDKVIQKTLSLWLSASLDQLYSKASYGYRKGYSRLGAKERISHLVRNGYTYALDADIADFFPSVDIQRILGRLKCLYGQDPLWQLLERFLRAEVDRSSLPEGYEQYHHAGLHLGSSLSPVLANLMLDHLDSVLTKLDYQLVRYADDFLVLCKTQKQAKAALDLVITLLDQQGLKLNDKKTSIKTFSEGIRFLGYLFVNDMALEVKAETQSTSVSETALITNNLPKADSHQDAQHLFYQHTTEQSLCITGDPCAIHLSQHRLRVERAEEIVANIPLHHLKTLLLFGRHQITTQALTESMQQGISIYFASSFGQYQGCAAALAHNPALYLQQTVHFGQETQRLAFAKALVSARIKSQKEVLRRREVKNEYFNLALNKLKQASDTSQCLGIEGQASKIYWQALKQMIPEEWAFKVREKPHAKDPINSLLSFGYSLLYSHTDSMIRSVGLYPAIGGYHHTRGTHSALASDLMEPFRYLVERAMLTLIKTGQITPNNFYIEQGQCWLDKESRKFWCRYLIEQLQKPQFSDPDGTKRSALELIQQQNHNVKMWIKGECSEFVPWIAR